MTTWLSGRKFTVDGFSGPETSTRVPLSATAPKAWLTPLRSCPSLRPRFTSRDVASHAMARRRRSSPMRTEAGRLWLRRKVATASGTSAVLSTSATVVKAASAWALNMEMSASPDSCPRSGMMPRGARPRRSSTTCRREAAHRGPRREAVEPRPAGEEAPQLQAGAHRRGGEVALELALAPVPHELRKRDAHRAHALAAPAEGGGV